MEPYNPLLKTPARDLRNQSTPAERWLWEFLRRKQIHGVQFYRQKAILSFIVDFYCPAAKLVIELDGQPHFEADGKARDQERNALLASLGLRVIRFENQAVLQDTITVVSLIATTVKERM